MPKRKLLDEVRGVLRIKNHSYRTEEILHPMDGSCHSTLAG